MEKIYVATNKLPGALGACFIGNTRPRGLEIRPADRAYACSGGQGTRAWFALLPDLSTPAGVKTGFGAFGGPNPFQRYEIDTYARDGVDVPEHGAFVTGVGGYVVCYMRAATLARIVAPDHPATMVASDAQGSDLHTTSHEVALEAIKSVTPKYPNAIRWTLYIFKSIKSGYRAAELKQLAEKTNGAAGTQGIVDELVRTGFLKRSSNGAISITTEGKNIAREAPYRADAVTASEES